ncbi:MAG: SoxR reducing system RseC family protein [Bacteroidales bacterium]|jgi:sigma-E factor negative regulatory protein RseC|nr:SoxR reducing system RseC family protein [Bacteroidales bacterium]MCI1785673.1 SoxR reducing system RseC family protein [Bacteroidales bacterium]
MNEILHKGRIVEMDRDFTTVEIISASACASCHAAGLCGVSEYTKKAIKVPSALSTNHHVGDEVDVALKQSMGNKAVWIAYAIPLMILMALILILSSLHLEELYVGLFSIAGVAVYYFCIFLFRKVLAKEYIFYIKN